MYPLQFRCCYKEFDWRKYYKNLKRRFLTGCSFQKKCFVTWIIINDWMKQNKIYGLVAKRV